ncbi:MAG: ABC transporter ATP-binding protein [Pseudomonadota bacterium]
MTESILHTEKLCKYYAGLRANHEVNFALKPGEIHALIGPNGAGKTTLVAQLSGELSPTSGSIHLEDKDITDLAMHQRALAGVARSFQVNSVFDEMSVLDNFGLAIQAHQDHSFRFWSPVTNNKSLQQQAADLAQRFGLGSALHHVAGTLAHGEKRQLEVGLTLAGNPRVLLLDEPMAGIGSGGSKVLTEMLDSLRQEYAILLVEHDMDAVFSLADRISVLVYGEVIASGSVEEIRNNPAVQQAYLGDTDA